jgi:uncharacterized protein YchJ
VVNLPAVCKKCGLTFGSGIEITNCTNSSFTSNTSKCPNCGSIAEILDCTTDHTGNIHFAKSAYDVLTNPAVAFDTLERLKGIISQQQKVEKKDAKNIVKTIQLEVPELSELTHLLVPSNAGEFYSMLGFLLTLIIFIQTMRSSNKEPNTTVINNYYGASNPESSAYEAAHKSGGLKRKDLCPCGSGKKFKNCHGE